MPVSEADIEPWLCSFRVLRHSGCSRETDRGPTTNPQCGRDRQREERKREGERDRERESERQRDTERRERDRDGKGRDGKGQEGDGTDGERQEMVSRSRVCLRPSAPKAFSHSTNPYSVKSP